ncbi:MAG: glycosyltransferase family 2 protein [Acidobacteriota bacterium]
MISVIVPAYNEEGGIATTLAAVRTMAGAADTTVEIVVVDDGSTDETAQVASRTGARVISHPHNLGYGRALKTGVDAATYDTIVIVDADGTYPVAEIPRLVATFQRGFDMVVGTRSGRAFREGVLKNALRLILTFLVEFTAGRRVPDVNSGLRVFSRATVMPYFGHLCDTFSFTTSLTLAYMMTGRFVAYEPIGYVDRVGRTKVRLWRDALRTLQYIVQAIVYYNPIKMFLMLSVATVLAATSAALALVVWQPDQLGVPALIATLGALVAVLLFGLGLTADLLRQIMHK